MKTSRQTKTIIAVAALGLLALAAGCSRSGHDHAGHDHGSAAADATGEWMTAAIAAYPLQTCVVSGDKLGGSMGPAFNHVHKEEGKPDRLVRFCCEGCIDEFKAAPAKFLAAIDAAAKAVPATR